MAEGTLCVAAGGKGDERGAWRTQAAPHLKEFEAGVQLKKCWLIWRG